MGIDTTAGELEVKIWLNAVYGKYAGFGGKSK